MSLKHVKDIGATTRKRSQASSLLLAFVFGVSAFLAGCRQDMHDQPKYRPLRPIDQIGSINDGRSARPLVEGTVARDQLRDDVEFYTGKLRQGAQSGSLPGAQAQGVSGSQASAAPAQMYQGFVTEFPMPIMAADLDRGQERFNIYCSVCHGRLGDGSGMIVRRGFRKPPSFHDERLRNAPIGYFFDVETNGFGAMPDYASQIPPEDRWRVIAYIRALQLSQRGTIADVPPNDRDKLSGVQQGGEKQGEHQQ
ncbi:MAG TPA: cytochrome c [Blastocatellia bacterium]|nr:cytochrome c [Blastocatellia bacterium]